MQLILAHLDNNASVINTLEPDLRKTLNTFELQVFRIRTRADFDAVVDVLLKVTARLSKLRRTERDFLQFLGGLVVMFTNMKYDDSFVHNICWYDIGDDGKLIRGRKKAHPAVVNPAHSA